MAMMTDARLLDLIDAYGAEPMCWPEDERRAAEAWLRSNPSRFAAALEAARRLDLAFEAEILPQVPGGLAARILADAPSAPRRKTGWLSGIAPALMPNGLRWPAGAALASLMMGLVAGYATAPAAAENDFQTEAENVVYAALGYDSFEAYIAEDDG